MDNLLFKHSSSSSSSSPHHLHHLHLNHDNSTSTSPHGTLSSTSSSLSNASSNNSNNNGFYENIKILLPNGLETVKKLDTRKAIYDILIELSASSKLQPSGYTLQLFNEDMKILDYTVTQTLAQIAPNVIKLVPKASTIKASTPTEMTNKNILNNNSSIINTSNGSTKHQQQHSMQQQQQQPSFEITIRVQVNLPHNQITAVRVKPNIKLSDLLKVICEENLLDVGKYKLIVSNSINFDQNEENYMNNRLSSYESNEVTLFYVNNNSRNSYLKQNQNQNSNEDYRIKNCQSNYSVNNEQKQKQQQSDFLNRSKSEIDLHDENNNNYKNNDLDPKGTRKSSILNLFRKKHRSKSRTNVNEEQFDAPKMKISAYNEQSAPLQQQQNMNRSSETVYFNAKKKQAPPPPPVAVPSEAKCDPKIYSLHEIIQTHKKKQAPPPPPPVAQVTPPQQKQKVEESKVTETAVSSTSTLSITNSSSKSSSAATIKTNDTAFSTTETVLPTTTKVTTATTENLNSPSSTTTKTSTENDNVTNSLTSSLASSKNFYQFDNNSEKQDDIQSVSDIEEPVFTKEKSIYNEKRTFDESSLSNNSKSSSIEDVSKAFALTIAVAEQYVAKDEALKAAATAVSAIKKLESLQQKSPSIEEYTLTTTIESNRVKAYNGAIIDKNTTMNSVDDFCDVEVNINLMPNEQIEKINYSYHHQQQHQNSTSNHENALDDIDNNRQAFSNINNENNREIEVIYESFNHDTATAAAAAATENNIKQAKNKETTYYDSLRRKSVKEIPDDYEDRQSSVIYSHKNLPSPPLSFSNKATLPKQQSLDERKVISMSPITTTPSSSEQQHQHSQLQRQVSTPIVDEHSSYKVIRPSDVYQKDGAFYSHDGTIRGYLGKVKKMTTSKVLSEIFTHSNENDIARDETATTQFIQPQQKVITQPKIMQPSSPQTPTKTIDEKLNKNSYNVIHNTSTVNPIVENAANANKPVPVKTTKSSLINIIQSEKKQHQISTNSMYNSSVNNMKTNLTSSSTTSVVEQLTTKPTVRPSTVAIKRDTKPIDSTRDSVKPNINLTNLQQQQQNEQHSTQYHHQPKISTSFVMSAKSKTNSYQSVKKAEEISIKDSLLNEIKSTVPLVEEYKVTMRQQQATPPPPPLPDLPPPDATESDNNFPLPPPPPPVAPKNFTLKTINNVQHIVPQANNRASLLESIKGFNPATSLRKTASSQR